MSALEADAEGWARRIPGRRFSNFGRVLGAKLARAGHARLSIDLMLTPVSSVRYWEFDFADRHLPQRGGAALDVSSPRLLALYLASRRRFEKIVVANPDPSDLAQTAAIARTCGINGITTRAADAVGAADDELLDAVWTISVIEHIPGDGDSDATRALARSLSPGGVLVITVPTDRTSWTEYRDEDVYGLGLTPERNGQYFFQRWYDLGAIERRIVDAVGYTPVAVEWFGERKPGTFARYIEHWMKSGPSATVRDPAFISREFRSFARWDDMPGMGICGLAFRADSLA